MGSIKYFYYQHLILIAAYATFIFVVLEISPNKHINCRKVVLVLDCH